MKNIILLLLVLVLIFVKASIAQVPTDNIKLPFAIADEKKLSDEDLKNKKEGYNFAGVPELSSDPVNGFGYGVEGSLFFNGKKSDPFFNYSPYRSKLDIVLFNTTRNQREIGIKLDVPYVFNSKWRLRGEVVYEINPNLLYFGVTEKESLAGLNYFPNGDSSQSVISNSKYNNYERSLKGSNLNYNRYTKEEYILNVSAERSYLDSKLRLLGGMEVAYVDITSFKENSLIRNDFNHGKILGLGPGLVTIAQVGIVYDTRDLEPDPNKGIFAEVTNEFSNKVLGSKYNFNKTFAQVKYYAPLFPNKFKKFIFAARYGMGYTAGPSPFFEYQDQWSSEGSIEGLGGSNTIRGYKQSRFLGRVMNFANFELRFRFAECNILKQHIAFSALPLFDLGGVWDNFSNVKNFKNYRYSEGMGLRVAWNVNTILRFDYAVSREDAQFFFNLGHAF